MLAVCATTGLVLLDPPTLKKAPTSVLFTHTFSGIPTASTWAPDNSVLFVASGNDIQRFSPAGTLLGTVAIPSNKYPITALASKDRGESIVFSSHDQLTVVDVGTGRVVSQLSTHHGPVSRLALSPDATLLASVARSATGAASEVHVHNLSLASHVEIQGLPRNGDVTACTFHIHSKAKLLLAVGTQLLVYDATKPTSSVKTIPLDRKSEEVVAITCSPFSKTLVAVGCSSGIVNLVDLDKEKGLFRAVALDVHLTSLVFSPEGAALYAGTDDGKLLILDLRALDKPPKSISVGENGGVISLSVQKKLRPGEGPRPNPRSPLNSLSKRKGSEPTSAANRNPGTGSQPGPSPSGAPLLKPKTSNLGSVSPGPSPGRTVRTRTISATTLSPSKPPAKSKVDPSKSTPPRTAPMTIDATQRSPNAMPMRARTISTTTSASSRMTSSSMGSRTTKLSTSGTSATSVSSPPSKKTSVDVRRMLSPPRSPSSSPGEEPFVDGESQPTRRRTSAGPSSTATEKPTRPATERMKPTAGPSSRPVPRRVPSGSSTVRSGASSTTAGRGAESISPRVRTLSSRSSTSAAAGPSRTTRPHSRMTVPSASISPVPPVPKLPEAVRQQEQLTEINIWTSSRTPSPELHGEDMTSTPMPMRRNKGKGKEKEVVREKTNVLGLGSPELRKWIESDTEDTDGGPGDRALRRKVDFLQVPPNEVQIQSIEVVRNGEQDEARKDTGEQGQATIQMTVQISPRRPPVNISPNWAPIPSLFSPSRNASQGQAQDSAGSPSTQNPAHELLQSLIRDAMYDYRRETKAEIMGLHLDLVRMGRGWRKELREALETWGEELKEIRRENELLRQENERLRRGY